MRPKTHTAWNTAGVDWPTHLIFSSHLSFVTRGITRTGNQQTSKSPSPVVVAVSLLEGDFTLQSGKSPPPCGSVSWRVWWLSTGSAGLEGAPSGRKRQRHLAHSGKRRFAITCFPLEGACWICLFFGHPYSKPILVSNLSALNRVSWLEDQLDINASAAAVLRESNWKFHQ